MRVFNINGYSFKVFYTKTFFSPIDLGTIKVNRNYKSLKISHLWGPCAVIKETLVTLESGEIADSFWCTEDINTNYKSSILH